MEQFRSARDTKYNVGDVFKRHNDASTSLEADNWNAIGGQRIVTCICYLNTVGSGGHTYFNELGVSVPPEAGKGLFFFPADCTTSLVDKSTIHESLPVLVTTGDDDDCKWIVQMFGRQNDVPSPLGIPNNFGEV